MKPVCTFTVYGVPQQRGSKRAAPVVRNGKPGIAVRDANPRSKDWMAAVAQAAAETWGDRELIAGPVALSVVFRFPRPAGHYGTGRNAGTLKASAPTHHAQSPDLSKLVRAVEDALTGVVWRDDRLVSDYWPPFRKSWTTGAACAVIAVYELERGL